MVRHRRRFLVATPAGRARLRAWLSAGAFLPPLPRAELADWIRYRVALWGDLAFLEDIVQGLIVLPAPVRQHALYRVAFVGVGRASVAWTASARLEQHGEPRERVVVLGPTSTSRTIVHECVHVWHAPLPTDGVPAPAVSTPGARDFLAYAAAEGFAGRLEDDYRRGEELAEGATEAWLRVGW
jgi:hypothetical protein